MGWFSDDKKPKIKDGIEFFKQGKKVKVVEWQGGKSTEVYYREGDKKLQKIAEKEFKQKGSLYYEGTVVRKGTNVDLGGTFGALGDLITGRGSGGGRAAKPPGKPVNLDGSPRSSWW